MFLDNFRQFLVGQIMYCFIFYQLLFTILFKKKCTLLLSEFGEECRNSARVWLPSHFNKYQTDFIWLSDPHSTYVWWVSDRVIKPQCDAEGHEAQVRQGNIWISGGGAELWWALAQFNPWMWQECSHLSLRNGPTEHFFRFFYWFALTQT